MAKARSTRPATLENARVRLRVSEAYLQVAELVLEEPDRTEMPGVSVGIAVLAGIAASNLICARRLGQIHRGQDHRAAAALLEQATPDGKKLAATFIRLIDLKDQAHYGMLTIPRSRPAAHSSGHSYSSTAHDKSSNDKARVHPFHAY